MPDSSVRYPKIPKRLWKYYQRLLKDNPHHKLVEAIKIGDMTGHGKESMRSFGMQVSPLE